MKNQSIGQQWYDEDRGIHHVQEKPASHKVVDANGTTKYTGNLSQCKAWMRRYNAYFFCEVKPCASECSHANQSKPSNQRNTSWSVNRLA